MSYNWTDASTPQGRERLKELLDTDMQVIGRNNNAQPVMLFRYDGGYVYEDQHDRYPLVWEYNAIMDFLDPSPRLEPPELQWEKDGEVGHWWARSGDWLFIAREDGTWDAFLNDNHMDGSLGVRVGDGTSDSAKAAIHEWRVNHLKSMTGL